MALLLEMSLLVVTPPVIEEPMRRRLRGLQSGSLESIELSGFIECGMAKEALALARKFLAKPDLTHQEFKDALHAVLHMGDSLDEFRADVEAAYARLPRAS